MSAVPTASIDGITSQLQWLSNLQVPPPANLTSNKALRKTSIIATIGPKTNSVEMIQALRTAGMNIVRMNFSHGSYEYHQSVIDNTREAIQQKQSGRPLAIALDTKGPEIRTGDMENGADVEIPAGHKFIVTTKREYATSCSSTHLYIDYANLPTMIEPGRHIYIDDGILALKVISISSDNTEVQVESINSGFLSSRKGVNLPGTDVDLPALSEKDKNDLRFGVKNGVDMIFASFIRRGEDVKAIREVLGEEGKTIKIISKIENIQGMANFDDILKETDGVMVARGDLGIEIPSSQVFMAQKMMIAKCNMVGKPVICATQMLESMTNNPRPTRAEISDVANAVLDGADCVMLSGETAKGKYPIRAVETMAETCVLAEATICYPPLFNELRALTPRPTPTTETVAIAAVAATLEQNAGAIVVMSTSGVTARLVSKYRPNVPVLTVTRNPQTARQIHLHRGCYPFFYPEPRPETDDGWQADIDNRIKFAFRRALELGVLDHGATAVVIQGWRSGGSHTNTMRILEVPKDDGILQGPGDAKAV